MSKLSLLIPSTRDYRNSRRTRSAARDLRSTYPANCADLITVHASCAGTCRVYIYTHRTGNRVRALRAAPLWKLGWGGACCWPSLKVRKTRGRTARGGLTSSGIQEFNPRTWRAADAWLTGHAHVYSAFRSQRKIAKGRRNPLMLLSSALDSRPRWNLKRFYLSVRGTL